MPGLRSLLLVLLSVIYMVHAKEGAGGGVDKMRQALRCVILCTRTITGPPCSSYRSEQHIYVLTRQVNLERTE